jgi:hypothetical protein
VILTKVVAGIILLTLWIWPIIPASSVISATSLPAAWKEILAGAHLTPNTHAHAHTTHATHHTPHATHNTHTHTHN